VSYLRGGPLRSPDVFYSPQGGKAELYYGEDARATLRGLPENSVHLVSTSPPYWGLRDYGATEDQIGLEDSLEGYVQALVGVFREVRRVLRSDGVLWLNLGDSYASGGRQGHGTRVGFKQQSNRGSNGQRNSARPPTPEGLKPKDLVGAPWRVAFALQQDGWYLRSAAPWVKRNPMPESVLDRPTTATEYVFLLAHPDSGGRYFYDPFEVRQRYGRKRNWRNSDSWEYSLEVLNADSPVLLSDDGHPLGFQVNPKPYRGAHFATWPAELVRPLILLGASSKGVCSSCGKPWGRALQSRALRPTAAKVGGDPGRGDGGARVREGSGSGGNALGQKRCPGGWAPPCKCDAPVSRPVVLDPFSGSATTGMVALSEGCDYVGVDLNPDYLPLAMARLHGNKAGPSERSTDLDALDLFGSP